MSPRSRSASRSYSPSPKRAERHHSPRRYSRERAYHSRSSSRHPPSPPAIPGSPYRRNRYSAGSKSFSRSPRRHRRGGGTRSRSRTRSSSRNYYRHRYTRDNPEPSCCIGVFGLSIHTTQKRIREIFSKFGPIERIQVVVDAQTGRSRGFGFIYYVNIADAKAAKDDCCGLELDGRRIRVDYSRTNRAHTPTPGVYKGNSLKYRNRDTTDRYRSQRPSSSYRRRYEHSRSRSYSPPGRHRY